MLRREKTKYKTRKQVQIFCMIKSNKDSEVTVYTHLAHPFVIAQI